MFSSTLVNAQSGQKWSVNGNSVSSGDFIGSVNPFPFLVKTNNLDRFLIDPMGKLYVMDFKNLGVGFVTFDISGKLIPNPFSGNATDVLTGNGTFQNIALVTGWQQIGFNLVNTNTANVGIGTSTPTEKLSVVGNILNDGFLLTRGISIIGRGQGERLNADTMQTNIMLMDTLSKIEGETRIVGNASVSEKFGIGTKYPTEALEIVGNSVINGNNVVRGSITGNTVNAGDLFLSNIQREQILTTNLSGQIVPMSQSQFQVLAFSAGPILKQCDTTGFQMAWVSDNNKMWADMPECAKVGIGTTTPQYTLDVIGNAHISSVLKVGNNTLFIDPLYNTGNSGLFENHIYTTNNSGPLYLQSNNNNNQNTFINAYSSGKVGIGTSGESLLAKLHVRESSTGWAGYFFNGAGNGKGVFIEAGSGSLAGEVLACRSSDGSGGTNYLLQVNTVNNPGEPAKGYVGIGTPSPDCAFHVETSDAANWTACFRNGYGNGKGVKIETGSGSLAGAGLVVGDSNNNEFFKVSNSTGYCYARDLIITSPPFPGDYVFESNYCFMSLKEREEYVKEQKHLPYMEEGASMYKFGASMGKTIMAILQNTEELTLYVIEMNKTIELLKKENEELRKQIGMGK